MCTSYRCSACSQSLPPSSDALFLSIPLPLVKSQPCQHVRSPGNFLGALIWSHRSQLGGQEPSILTHLCGCLFRPWAQGSRSHPLPRPLQVSQVGVPPPISHTCLCWTPSQDQEQTCLNHRGLSPPNILCFSLLPLMSGSQHLPEA